MECDVLKSASEAYVKLMNIEYHIVLGRKGKETDLVIAFRPENFYHLAGFHKLQKRYSFQQKTSAWILRHILDGSIELETINKDKNFPIIVSRLHALCVLESIIDEGETKFFGYDNKKITFASRIDADYLAQGKIADEEIVFSFFVKTEGMYCMNSIFIKDKYDYSLRQTQYTVLLKEKKISDKQNTLIIELYRHNKYNPGN